MYSIMQSTSRRAFLSLPLLGISGTAYARYVEPTWLEVTERSCAIPKLTKPVELVHLSDFHASVVVSPSLIERAIDMAIDLKPHLFCVTGDFVTCTSEFYPKWNSSALPRLDAQQPTYSSL